jgi:hypothetical protein
MVNTLLNYLNDSSLKDYEVKIKKKNIFLIKKKSFILQCIKKKKKKKKIF